MQGRRAGAGCRLAVEPAIRSNIVIAVGDLALRFPNTLEPWTANMYRPLSDSDPGAHPTPHPGATPPAPSWSRVGRSVMPRS